MYLCKIDGRSIYVESKISNVQYLCKSIFFTQNHFKNKYTLVNFVQVNTILIKYIFYVHYNLFLYNLTVMQLVKYIKTYNNFAKLRC